MSTAAERQLAEALWMAVQDLDNEADVLRAVGGEAAAEFADDAERQARQLREFARRQAARVDDAGGSPAREYGGRRSARSGWWVLGRCRPQPEGQR